MHLQAFTDATNGVVTTHVENGTRGGMNRTTTWGSTNGTGMGTGVGVGTGGRGGYGMSGAAGNGAYGNGTGDGICVTE
jgi:hypothetical protein